MNLISFPKMVVSSDEAWPELERLQLPLSKLLTFLIIPAALLPPVLLYYSGSHYGDEFVAGFGSKPWGFIAPIFFLTETLTVLLMGWLLNQVAQTHGLRMSGHDSLMLAAIAPIPMWLSSLSLLVPSLAFNAGIALLALVAGCSLLHHGIQAFGHTKEGVSVAEITQTVMGAGIACWALLLGLIVAL